MACHCDEVKCFCVTHVSRAAFICILGRMVWCIFLKFCWNKFIQFLFYEKNKYLKQGYLMKLQNVRPRGYLQNNANTACSYGNYQC